VSEPLDPTEPYEPYALPGPAVATEPIRDTSHETNPTRTPAGRSVGLGSVVGAAILSAILASGGTVAVLEGTGALHAPLAPTGSGVQNATSHPATVIDESSAVIDAAARVSPAVVRITATGVTTDPFGATIPEQGVGSGVIFDPAGWVLTNRHVVQTGGTTIATTLNVELKDGREFKGTVYGVDTLTDLAIVRIDATNLPSAPIGRSADLKVGQLAIAIGSPLGTFSNSVTSGIVSATGRSVVVDSGARLTNLIQTDAAINPGNSGGPLLDAGGNVVGINTAVASGSNGIGFAIPIDIARPIMREALAGQPLARPYLGVRYEAIDLKLQAEKKLPVDHGALIGPATEANGTTLPAIIPGGPAEKAGLKDGDIITAVEDQPIDTEHPLDLVLSGFSPDQKVKLTLLRDGATLTIEITLGTRPNL
jgi:serine protease Do